MTIYDLQNHRMGSIIEHHMAFALFHSSFTLCMLAVNAELKTIHWSRACLCFTFIFGVNFTSFTDKWSNGWHSIFTMSLVCRTHAHIIMMVTVQVSTVQSEPCSQAYRIMNISKMKASTVCAKIRSIQLSGLLFGWWAQAVAALCCWNILCFIAFVYSIQWEWILLRRINYNRQSID